MTEGICKWMMQSDREFLNIWVSCSDSVQSTFHTPACQMYACGTEAMASFYAILCKVAAQQTDIKVDD